MMIVGMSVFFALTLFQPVKGELPREQRYQYAVEPTGQMDGYDIYPSVYYFLKKSFLLYPVFQDFPQMYYKNKYFL